MIKKKLQEFLNWIETRIETKIKNGFFVNEYELLLYVLYRDSEEAQ